MGDDDAVLDWLAHAFDPSRWRRSSLVIASAVFVLVAIVTVVQRILVADSAVGWAITVVHATVVVVAVPALIRHAWRSRRAAR